MEFIILVAIRMDQLDGSANDATLYDVTYYVPVGVV